MNSPLVAVIILNYNTKDYLSALLKSLSKQSYRNLIIYLIDNHSNDGSQAQISRLRQDYVGQAKLKTIFNTVNVGYAKANNLGLKKAFTEGADLCLLLNPDVIADKKMIEKLVDSFNQKIKSVKRLGLIQPVILLTKFKNKINSFGNIIHYLGFGYCGDYLRDYQKLTNDKKIFSVSGAAMLVTQQYFNQVGGFDDDFFMISEDQDLSWRGLLYGYQHYISTGAVAYHDYYYNRHPQKKFFEEKNRLMMLLKNYSTKTLFLLAPILLINEIAILTYSIIEGGIGLKLKTYWLIFHNRKIILNKRNEVQKKRIIADKALFREFKPTIDFSPINNLVIRYLVNPLYLIYYRFVFFLL